MKKIRILCILLSILLLLTGCGGAAQETNDGPFSGGTGTQDDPFRISNAEDLWEMCSRINEGEKENREIYAEACYLLTANINLEDKNWTPIGDESVPFAGILDGDGHSIYGLQIKAGSSLLGDQERHYGLVGNLNKGTIRNLTITDSQIKVEVESSDVAAFAGHSFNGTLENCHTTGTVEITGSFDVAGICANLNKGSTVRNCSNAAAVTSTGDVGGAAGIGYFVSCPITDCSNSGTITSAGDAAGIAVSASGGISDCTNSGTVTADDYAAGITCRFDDGALNATENNANVSLFRCTNSGSITSKGDPAGGIAVSCRTGSVEQCVNSGSVTALAEAGGIFAYFQPSAFGTPAEKITIVSCSNSGTVISQANYAAGGICGGLYAGSTKILLESCENSGTVQATGKKDVLDSGAEAGGIIGTADVTVLHLNNCSNSGNVSGFAYAGGIVGRAYVSRGVEVEETEFLAEGCRNTGDIYATDPGGLKIEVFAGGITGHCRVVTEDAQMLPAFGMAAAENCENTGKLSGDQHRARFCSGDLFGNSEDFAA